MGGATVWILEVAVTARRATRRALVVGAAAALLSACGSSIPASSGSSQNAAAAARLREATLPNLSRVDASARERIEAGHRDLMTALQDGTQPATLADAAGDLGLLLMAAEFYEAAEPYFAGAAALAPSESRWPYYLAHVYRRTAKLGEAAAAFEQTLRIQPGDLASVWWLGLTYLDLGRERDADAQFARTESDASFAVAALYGRGRAALAQQDYSAAVRYFERVLSLDKAAAAAHYPLGLAYRGLGRVAEADAHLRRRTSAEIRPPDHLIDALAGLLDTADAHYGLGIEASRVAAWGEAIAQFRQALAIDPRHTAALLNLSVALHRQGDDAGALAEARKVLGITPTETRAHYVIGTIEATAGRDEAAIDAYRSATRIDPRFIEARLSLAAALRRRGRLQEALGEYDAVMRQEPSESEAQFGSAITLVRLGRYREARDRLLEGMTAHPDEARFPHALARVLAASPAADVRDGRRAVAIMEQLMAAEPTVDRAHSLAMALAEAGRFTDAIALQRRAIATAAEGGDARGAAAMAAALRAYQRREPIRTPWPEDDPIFFPPPEDIPAVE
jgi:tetratricopeptide (TPR) repeat protein